MGPAPTTRTTKRVRFEEDNERRVRRRIVALIPLSVDITPEEKNRRWFQDSEMKDLQMSVVLEAKRQRAEDKEAAAQQENDATDSHQKQQQQQHLSQGEQQERANLSFSHSFSKIYIACQAESANTSSLHNKHAKAKSIKRSVRNVFSAVPQDTLHFMFMTDTYNLRGVEDFTVQRLGLQRRKMRSQYIKLIQQAYKNYRQEVERDTCWDQVRCVSETLTRPSRTMAAFLGATDAIAAQMTTEEQQGHHGSNGTLHSTAPGDETPPVLKDDGLGSISSVVNCSAEPKDSKETTLRPSSVVVASC